VIATDYACLLADHDALDALARRHGVRILHDAAHAIGSRHRGRMIGGFSDIAIFSFDPVKTFTCIDGGAVVVRTSQEHARLCEMRLVGMGQPSETLYRNERAWTYDVRALGFRYHMANLHAAIGLAQLRKADRIARTRRETCRAYNEAFASLASHGVRTPATGFDDVVPFLYYLRVPADRRDALRTHLRERGVDTGIHWQPGHWFTLLREARRGDLSVTERVGREILSIPLHSSMPASWRERVIEAVASFFEGR
jgi:dTDP-4-amino-4,6-dideoxygalactose transaminase